MEVLISSKVLKYMEKEDFDGIKLSKEIIKFGWAGCKDTFRGEFVEKGKEIKNQKAYQIETYQGVKVFVPVDMQKFSRIEIKSSFSLFKALVLSVDVVR